MGGAVVQWLRDELHSLPALEESELVAAQVPPPAASTLSPPLPVSGPPIGICTPEVPLSASAAVP